MSDNDSAGGNRETRLEKFAAELTNAAYAVALRHGVEDKWLDLELELWGAMKNAVKKCEQRPVSQRLLSPIGSSDPCSGDDQNHESD